MKITAYAVHVEGRNGRPDLYVTVTGVCPQCGAEMEAKDYFTLSPVNLDSVQDFLGYPGPNLANGGKCGGCGIFSGLSDADEERLGEELSCQITKDDIAAAVDEFGCVDVPVPAYEGDEPADHRWEIKGPKVDHRIVLKVSGTWPP